MAVMTQLSCQADVSSHKKVFKECKQVNGARAPSQKRECPLCIKGILEEMIKRVVFCKYLPLLSVTAVTHEQTQM